MSELLAIPANPDEALEMMGTVAGGLMRYGWERTLLVYALTYDGREEGAHPDGIAQDGRRSVSAFAELGIIGLASNQSVARERAILKMAIADGLVDGVRLGDSVAIPEVDWLDYRDRARGKAWVLPRFDEVADALGGEGENGNAGEPPALPSLLLQRRELFEKANKSTTTTHRLVNNVALMERTDDADEIAMAEQMRVKLNEASAAIVEYVNRELVNQ